MRGQDSTARAHVTPTAVPSLGRWGVSAEADMVYRALAQLGPAMGQQLARHLGVEPARVGRALDELAALGAVRPPRHSRERRWSAVDPGQLPALAQRRSPLLIGEQQRRHLAVVAGLHLDRLPPTTVHRLPTRAATRNRIAKLVAAEQHEHLAINTEAVISADAAAAARPLDRSLLARGVRMRTLGLPPCDGRRETTPAGSEHREAETLPLKLMVFDRQSALFPVDPSDFNVGAIEITDPDAVEDLTRLFYDHWRAADNTGHPELPPVTLTVREQAIVALLTAGVSEEAAASRLGLSRRTVVYALRALMDRFCVENRFQLALILGAARAVPIPMTRPPAPPTIEGQH